MDPIIVSANSRIHRYHTTAPYWQEVHRTSGVGPRSLLVDDSGICEDLKTEIDLETGMAREYLRFNIVLTLSRMQGNFSSLAFKWRPSALRIFLSAKRFKAKNGRRSGSYFAWLKRPGRNRLRSEDFWLKKRHNQKSVYAAHPAPISVHNWPSARTLFIGDDVLMPLFR